MIWKGKKERVRKIKGGRGEREGGREGREGGREGRGRGEAGRERRTLLDKLSDYAVLSSNLFLYDIILKTT